MEEAVFFDNDYIETLSGKCTFLEDKNEKHSLVTAPLFTANTLSFLRTKMGADSNKLNFTSVLQWYFYDAKNKVVDKYNFFVIYFMHTNQLIAENNSINVKHLF